ncbi:S8 family serine peptidase [Bacillus sp. EAC]|uniref:S8 family serine peptidase n=1 Tax=Bacillus sp. EAC TaxID=1978338 RepID=UPI000B43EDF1|nr:S8 family serine peptidase [Bacillus sp. EAC]
MKEFKRKSLKVLATASMLSMFFSSFTASAESPKNNSVPKQSVDEILKQGREILLKRQKALAPDVKDQFGYKDLKEKGLAKAYKPDEQVRLIVEIEEPSTNEKSGLSKKERFKQKQDQVISQIPNSNDSKSKSASNKIKHRYYEGFNGFSLQTEFQNIKEIESIPGVTNVHIARTYQPAMGASKELVQAQKVWNQYGYEGEGLLVAIIDSGIDYTHKDMTLTEKGKQKEKWTQDGIKAKFAETSVNEVWYSDKVPTGYDWADEDTDVIPGEYGSSHGTHVAGTVGANGDETTDGVEGIAPGVQLLAEKVFSDYSDGATEDDIIAGIEHAVTMGADVINMSLGTDSGYVGEENDPIQKSIRQATEQGSLVIVASGNASYSSKNYLLQSSLKPYAENPDIGVVGEPSVSPYAISVASYENSKVHFNTLAESNGMQLPFQDQTQFPSSYNFKFSKALSSGQDYELVYVGGGLEASDFNKDLKGKIAVVKLQDIYSFYSTFQFDAEAKGAKAIIIIPPDNNEMEDYPYLRLSPYSIPVASTGKAVGDALISKLTSGQVVKMHLSNGIYIDNPTKNTMSDFSSIGAPHTLDFKPELSAPGGSIYSTVPGNDYEVMSGTSMATPHVAGGSALLLQSLYEKGLSHSKETALKAKIALMNTAKILKDPRKNNEVPYSPRVQGSGLMQIQNAIKTPVLVTSKNTSLEQAGAVALKEIKNDRAIFNLNAESLQKLKPKEELEYSVFVDVLTDETEMKEFDLDNDGTLDSKEYLTLSSKRLDGVNTYVNGEKVTSVQGTTLKIKSGQEKNLNVEIRLPRGLKKGAFIEGFVRLEPTGKGSDSAVPLTVPYMGFNGEWDQAKNIDPVAWDKDAFLGYTALWDDVTSLPMGYDPSTGRFDTNHIAVSPNFYGYGAYSTFTALRNLQKTEMFVQNQKGKTIQYLGDFSEYTGKPWKFRKNIMAYGDYMVGGYLWDMTDQNGNIVPDGDYEYVIKTTLDYKNAKPQEVKLPIKVDSVAPTVSDIQVKPKDGKYEISYKAEDTKNGSGFKIGLIWCNGQYMDTVELGKTSLIVDEEPKSIVVMGVDYAYNQGYTVWGDPSYINEEMVVSFFWVDPQTDVNKDNPAYIISYASNRVDWTIKIKNSKGEIVDSFEVKNEHSLRTQWTPKADLPDGTYYMSADVVTKSGFKVTTKPVEITVKQ